MSKPSVRTKNIIKSSRRSPGNKIVTRYLKKGKVRHSCSICGTVMTSVKSTGAKSSKTQTRIYGGNLCHACLEAVLKYSAKVKCKALKIEEVPIKYRVLIGRAVERL